MWWPCVPGLQQPSLARKGFFHTGIRASGDSCVFSTHSVSVLYLFAVCLDLAPCPKRPSVRIALAYPAYNGHGLLTYPWPTVRIADQHVDIRATAGGSYWLAFALRHARFLADVLRKGHVWPNMV